MAEYIVLGVLILLVIGWGIQDWRTRHERIQANKEYRKAYLLKHPDHQGAIDMSGTTEQRMRDLERER